MSRTFIRFTAVLALGAGVGLAACSDDSGDAGGDVAAFCAAGQSIESATAVIDSQESALVAFSALGPVIQDLVDTAPDDIADDAGAFADHVSEAVESGDFTAFEDSTVDTILARFDALCTDG